MRIRKSADLEVFTERFERKTIPEPNSGCLLWLGSCRPHGYGKMYFNGRLTNATHIAMALAGTPVPEGKQALHTCDNPYCVNVDHLFVGDPLANVADMIAKGRQNFSGLIFGRIGNNKKGKSRAAAA